MDGADASHVARDCVSCTTKIADAEFIISVYSLFSYPRCNAAFNRYRTEHG